MTSNTPLRLPIEILPEEVWIKIFCYLRPTEILRIRLVCKHWASLSTQLRIRKKFVLKLKGSASSHAFKAFLINNQASYLPISNLSLSDQIDENDLEFILKKIGPKLQGLELVNTMGLKTLHDVDLSHIRELHFKFHETPPYLLKNAKLDFLEDYKHLTSLSVECSYDLLFFGRNILRKISEVDEVPPLQRLSFNFHYEMSEIFLKIMKIRAISLRELEIYFDQQSFYWNPNRKFEALQELKNLETLKVSGCWKIDFISAVFQNLPKTAPLECIEFNGVTTLTDDLLTYIIHKWTNSIKRLTILFSGKITGKGVAEIWKLHKNLESLHIGACHSISINEVISAIGRDKNIRLRELHAHYMDFASEEGLWQLVQNLPNLEILDLSSNSETLKNKVLTYIFCYQTHMRQIFLEDSCDLEWPHLYPIKRQSNLEVLSLRSCGKLRDIFTDYLIFPVLRVLKLHNLGLSPLYRLRKFIDNCPMLEILHLNFYDNLNDETIYYICDHLKLLMELNIYKCIRVSETAIDYARNIKRIKINNFERY